MIVRRNLRFHFHVGGRYIDSRDHYTVPRHTHVHAKKMTCYKYSVEAHVYLLSYIIVLASESNNFILFVHAHNYARLILTNDYLLQLSSCPAQPCLTFTQLRNQFFVHNDQFLETIPIGDTSLVFLPGNHSLQDEQEIGVDFDFIKVGEYTSISFTGYNHSQPAVINCKNNSGPYFSAFESVSITNLRFRNCVTYAWQIDVLQVNNVDFDTALLDVRFAASATVSSSSVTLGEQIYCGRVELYGMFHSNATQVNLRNVVFSSYNFDCDNPKLVNFNSGDLDIADCAFSGNALHIVLRNGTLDVAGTTRFENGNNAILALSSTVTLAGNVSFVNNTGYQGGAVSLTDSRLTVADNACVTFQANHADYVGGAIFASGNDISNYVSIGQTIGQPTLGSCQISFGANSRVNFINNTAESGGSAMHGITASILVCTDGRSEYGVLSDIISIDPDDFSAVSSDPLRVCICPDQSTPDCLAILPDQNIPHLHYTVYPGQTFTIPAAVVGFNFALTSGSVYAQFLNSDASLGSESLYVQDITHTMCSQLQYSVLSDRVNRNETLALTANSRRVTGTPSDLVQDIQVLNENEGYLFFDFTSYNYFPNPPKYYKDNGTFAMNQTDGVFRLAGHVPRPLQDVAVFTTLTILECPSGFTLSDRRCGCNEIFLTQKLTCNINDQTVRRDGTTWIKFGANSSAGVLVHKHCPFSYCKQEPVDVGLTNPDTQCAFNHSGNLCGGCKPNFSLALGTNHCLQNCSNNYIALLFPFAIAGFALVFFIKILNLTVSQGTLNGLIFYANIVAASQSIFIPEQHNKFLSFVSVFISWLNLDLGIETCFIKGLDGYWKVWLQFLFPFYVWAIAGTVILASRYSTRATKAFGKNSLAVLATLFFLSYTKIVRTVVVIFSFATFDGFASAVWAFDGNIQYFVPKRIPLFLFALTIVFLFWLPYTSILLSAQWLRTKTHRKGLRWLKPFLDAYYGPFKDKHHYWIGVLLVVRAVLFILFAFFLAIENNVNLLLVIVSSFSLAICPSITGSLYRKTYLTALESSFLLNLGVLAAGTLFIRLVGGSQEALITTSAGIAFLQFVGILVFHAYRFVIVPLRNRKIFTKSQDQASRFQLTTPLIFKSDDITRTDVYLSRLDSSAENPTSSDQLSTDEISTSTRSNSEPFEVLTYSAPVAVAGGARTSAASLEEPSPEESCEPPRYFAAKRTAAINFTAPRESFLEVTQ